MTIGRCALIVWLGWCWLQTSAYAPVWRTDLTLWTHGELTAPWFPRAIINHGKALIAVGDRERGVALALKGYELERRRQDARRAGLSFAR